MIRQHPSARIVFSATHFDFARDTTVRCYRSSNRRISKMALGRAFFDTTTVCTQLPRTWFGASFLRHQSPQFDATTVNHWQQSSVMNLVFGASNTVTKGATSPSPSASVDLPISANNLAA
jgi:hypothetical protein